MYFLFKLIANMLLIFSVLWLLYVAGGMVFRWELRKIPMAVAVAGVLGSAIIVASSVNLEARSQGFASYSDLLTAYNSGYGSPDEWRKLKEQQAIKLEAEAKKAETDKDALVKFYQQKQASIELVKQSLKDPNSANIIVDSVKTNEGFVVVCGRINAKNSFGAYSGFSRFVSSAVSSHASIDPGEPNNSGFQNLWYSYCS